MEDSIVSNGTRIIFKHSNRCPISARAKKRIERFEEESDLDIQYTVVQDDRERSDRIAEETGVTHETPQVLFFKDGDVVWHASHDDITEESLKRAEEKLK